MTATSSSKKPVEDQALLAVEYSTVGGVELGAGLHEREYHLRVDVERSVIELAQHAPMSDFSIDPIGQFRCALTPEERGSLTAACRAAGFGRLPAPSGGGVGTSLITLRCRFADNTAVAAFSSRDVPSVEGMRPLLNALNPLLGKALRSPLQALRLELSPNPAADGRFHFSLRNIGTMPLAVVPPAVSSEVTPTGVQVAPMPVEAADAPWPPDWDQRLLEKSRAAPAKKPVRLAPGAAIELVTGPWRGKRGARYVAQARLGTYEGPPAHEGLPVIKGNLLSQTAIFVHP